MTQRQLKQVIADLVPENNREKVFKLASDHGRSEANAFLAYMVLTGKVKYSDENQNKQYQDLIDEMGGVLPIELVSMLVQMLREEDMNEEEHGSFVLNILKRGN